MILRQLNRLGSSGRGFLSKAGLRKRGIRQPAVYPPNISRISAGKDSPVCAAKSEKSA